MLHDDGTARRQYWGRILNCAWSLTSQLHDQWRRESFCRCEVDRDGETPASVDCRASSVAFVNRGRLDLVVARVDSVSVLSFPPHIRYNAGIVKRLALVQQAGAA